MGKNGAKKSQKVAQNFYCEKCDYTSHRKNDYDKHLQTKKHAQSQWGKMGQKVAKSRTFFCDCGKSYVYQKGLNRHKQVCQNIKKDNLIINEDNICDLTNKINILTKQNNVLMEAIEAIKDKPIQQINNIKTNTINNFNLNLFLNEECKDALNISDFVKQLKIGLKELEYTNEHGIDEGLLKIFKNGLDNVGVYKRPIHSTDIKRETIYIKNNDGWSKESSKETLKKELKCLQNKQLLSITNWTQENPDYCDDDNKKEAYVNIVENVMTNINDSKIVKDIIKNTHINDIRNG